MAEGRLLLTVPIAPPRTLGVTAGPADWLEADAEVEGHTFVRAEVEGGRIDGHWVMMGLRRPDGREFVDLWLSPDGSRAHFRVLPSYGPVEGGAPGEVRVVFASANRASEVVVTAPFRTGPARTLVLPSGDATSSSGFYSGPSGRSRELLVGTDSRLRVGLRYWDPESSPGGLVSTWQPLFFETWIPEAVPGRVTAAPRVTVDAGRVHLASWVPDNRLAQLVFDPRDEDGRMRAGRRRMVITWKVGEFVGRTTRVATVFVVVGLDGSIELVAG